MGLVKTRPRLAEDMHRRGEASEGTLPKATRRARKRVRSPHRAGAEMLPMWECCQFQLGIEIGHWQRGNVFTRWVRLGWASQWARVLRPLSATSGRGTNCPFVVNMWQA